MMVVMAGKDLVRCVGAQCSVGFLPLFSVEEARCFMSVGVILRGSSPKCGAQNNNPKESV